MSRDKLNGSTVSREDVREMLGVLRGTTQRTGGHHELDPGGWMPCASALVEPDVLSTVAERRGPGWTFYGMAEEDRYTLFRHPEEHARRSGEASERRSQKERIVITELDGRRLSYDEIEEVTW